MNQNLMTALIIFEEQVKKKCTSSKLSRIKNMLGYEISAEIPLESILKKTKHKV